MAILRKQKRTHYTIIENTVFMDYELSYKAKGLLCQMLSLPDGWSFSIEGLARLSSDGKSSVASALDELKEAGYFIRRQVRSGNRISGIEYVISETKLHDFQELENQELENQELENQDAGNQPQLNTKELSTKKYKTNLHTHKEQRPTLEEINKYISEKHLNVDAEKFFNYFDAGDWLDSKGEPVRSWKQKLITWSNKNGNNIGTGGGVRNGVRSSDGKSQRANEQVETGFIPHA